MICLLAFNEHSFLYVDENGRYHRAEYKPEQDYIYSNQTLNTEEFERALKYFPYRKAQDIFAGDLGALRWVKACYASREKA